MTESTPTPADCASHELNELIHNPLVHYLATCALTGGTAQRIAQEFFTLGAASTSQGPKH
jgi:hypothetical protein